MKRMLFVILALAFSTNLASPLFPLYRAQYHLSTSTITLLYAVYAFGVLAMLLIGGTLAERYGSRSVAAAGVLLALLSAVLFIAADGPSALFAGRLVGGLAVGTFMGTSNSLLLKMTPPDRRARIMGFSSTLNLFGFGLGPALGGLWIHFLPGNPTRGPFLFLFATLLAALVVLLTLRVSRDEEAAAAPLAIRLGVPRDGRWLFWGVAGPAIFVSFGLGSIAFSLLPGIAAHLFGRADRGIGGLLIFLMTTTGALFQLILRPADSRIRLLAGLAMLVVGTWTVIAGELIDLPAAILAGSIIQGAGNGWTFQTSLRLAAEVAVLGDRIRVMSTYFLCGYLGLSVPALLTGSLAHQIGLLPAITVISTLLTIFIAGSTAIARRAYRGTVELV